MADQPRFTIIQQGDGNRAHQVNGPVGRLDDPVADRESMITFLDAATGSLAALELSSEARAEALRTVEKLAAEDGDDGPARDRRRALAASLWRIVEGAAGSALGAALVGLWHP
jgi:MoxR-like ATPase